MAKREPWAELVTTLIMLYLSWVANNPGASPFGPAFWYHAHRTARTIGRITRELEIYLHRKYLDSVMH